MKGHKITEEEKNQIYRLIAAGSSPKEIAKITGLSIHTIRDMRQDADKIPDTDPEAKTVPKSFRADWEATRYWVLKGLKKGESLSN